MRIRKRKSVFALLGPLPQTAGYVVVPLLLSRSARRHGWRRGRPGPANVLGLVPLIGGAAVIGAAIASHYSAAPEQMRVGLIPDYLVTTGIYRRTRNPLYVGGVLMQVGWAALLGSLPGAAVTAAYVIGLDRLGIPFEERLLATKFGASYDAYRDRVPRWI